MRALTIVLPLFTASLLAQSVPYKIVNSFPNPQGTNYASGLAYARGVLWLGCAFNSTIYRADAYTGAMLGSFTAPTSSVRGLTHDGAFLWIASWSDNRIYQVLDTTGTVISSFTAFATPAHADGLAWDGAFLLISDESNGIHWFTPQGTLIRSITVPASGTSNPRDLAWDGTAVWAGYQSTSRIRRHDPLTGAILFDMPAPSGTFQQGLEWADGYLWSTGGANATISQIDFAAPYAETAGTLSTSNQFGFRVTEAQGQVGNLAVILLSQTGVSPFTLGGFTIRLSVDPLTQLSLNALPLFSATVDASGLAQTPPFTVPPIVPGYTFWAAGVTLSGLNITAVTDPIRFQSK